MADRAPSDVGNYRLSFSSGPPRLGAEDDEFPSRRYILDREISGCTNMVSASARRTPVVANSRGPLEAGRDGAGRSEPGVARPRAEPGSFRLACVQVSAGNEVGPNVDAASKLVRRAAGEGADLVSLPECAALIEPDRAALKRKVSGESAPLSAFAALADELGIWLHVGSIATVLEGGRIANRGYLVDPGGAIAARYDKIHMFDVDLEDGESYRESDTYEPGDRAVCADLPWGRLGFTICYDVRFPSLYAHLAEAGADFIGVPSAFTRKTGQAHWHVLLRARAIETGCWIFAAAQCGEHAGARRTYGHSLIVDPWGRVVAEADDEPGVIVADIDPARVRQARRAIPSLANARRFAAAGDAPPCRAASRTP